MTDSLIAAVHTAHTDLTERLAGADFPGQNSTVSALMRLQNHRDPPLPHSPGEAGLNVRAWPAGQGLTAWCRATMPAERFFHVVGPQPADSIWAARPR